MTYNQLDRACSMHFIVNVHWAPASLGDRSSSRLLRFQGPYGILVGRVTQTSPPRRGSCSLCTVLVNFMASQELHSFMDGFVKD